MGKTYESIDQELKDWIESQQMYFVATAPLAADGHVNCSPKGLDSFRVLGERQVGYVDLTGSGVETIAHLNENGRIVILFCSFDRSPKIIRLHGKGRLVTEKDAEFAALSDSFPSYLGSRGIIVVDVDRISDSCGWGVPVYEYRGQRESLPKWAQQKGEQGVSDYQSQKNAASIDGLPGLS